MTSTPPPVFSDRYELVRHIARGGMAQVYLARDLLLDRQVALKVLFPELSVDQSFVQRFRREAQAAANLSHPNIVSIYDWGQGEHTYCIVMEYVDGRTLSAIAREEPLDPRRAAAVGGDVARALEFAHQRGVIHRDIKPGNVLIDRNGQVKVADFGIARAVGAKEGLTQTGAVMGTATYFSPEQAQGYPVDARSDVYSLGVVLYEVVAGRAPFTGDNPVAIAYKHVREDPIPLRQINASVPVAYEAVVAKAMAKDADGRYQTAAELGADLDRFRQGEPVHAAAAVAATTVASAVGTTRVQPATTSVAPRTVVEDLIDTGEHVIEEEEERPRRGRLALLLLALLALLAVGLFFLGRHLGWWDSSPTRAVPTSVVGQSQAQATRELNAAGFNHLRYTTVVTSQQPQGDVVTTRPVPGTKVHTSSTITVVVSAGPQQVAVPDVVGKTQPVATAALQAAGFKVNVTMQASPTVTQGVVISTTPPSGQKFGVGGAVTIVVSTGKPQVVIPSVAGDTGIEAANKLGNLGLSVTTATEASNTYSDGVVTRTNPPAGTAVSTGSTVTVYVSTGPAQVTVPDLSGQTESQAASTLAGAGLKASFTTTAVSSPGQNGVVISQSPSSGTTAAEGSTVTVAIGSYTAPSTTTTTTVPPSTTTTSLPGPTTTTTT